MRHLRFESIPADSDEARSLLSAMRDEMAELYDDLDTGFRQAQSERLFREAGCRPIGNFNGNPMASFFGEKRL